MYIIDLMAGPRCSTISVNSPDPLNPEDRITEIFSFTGKDSNNRYVFRKTVGIAKYLYNDPESGNWQVSRRNFYFTKRQLTKSPGYLSR